MKKAPPKISLDNFFLPPVIKKLFEWFAKNDPLLKEIYSPYVLILFQEGYRPDAIDNSTPENMEEMANLENLTININEIGNWLEVKIWLDLIYARRKADKEKINLEQALGELIDTLVCRSSETLTTAGEIIIKYNIDAKFKNLYQEINKIPTQTEVEVFKQNVLSDALLVAETRVVSWIYKELFNKIYEVKKENLFNDEKRVNNSLLSFFSISQYAIENINLINSIDQILNHFSYELNDITEQKHKEIEESMGIMNKMSVTNTFLGQENRFFMFNVDGFYSEIGIDFLPRYPNKYLGESLKPMEEKNEQGTDKILVNLRCQIVSNDDNQTFKLKEKYEEVLSYITSKYGEGNKTEEEIALLSLIGNHFTIGIKCWVIEKSDRKYSITLYCSLDNGAKPYSSFAISDLFWEK